MLDSEALTLCILEDLLEELELVPRRAETLEAQRSFLEANHFFIGDKVDFARTFLKDIDAIMALVVAVDLFVFSIDRAHLCHVQVIHDWLRRLLAVRKGGPSERQLAFGRKFVLV